MSVKEGGAFETFRDPNGNVLITLNRDGTVQTAGIDFADGTTQTTAAAGGGAVSSVFGRSGAVVATNGDYTAAQVGAFAAHQTQTTLSNSQILNMGNDNSAVTVVTAIAGKILVPISVLAKFSFVTAAYGGVGTSDLHVSADATPAGFPLPIFVASSSSFLDGAVGATSAQLFLSAGTGFNNIYLSTGGGNLVISCTSNLTGGNAANTLLVSVQYLIYDIATGVLS